MKLILVWEEEVEKVTGLIKDNLACNLLWDNQNEKYVSDMDEFEIIRVKELKLTL